MADIDFGEALGAMSRGVVAATVGTLAMDTLLYRRYEHDGGDQAFAAWETSQGLDSWDDAPGPARAAQKVLGAVLGREIPSRYVRPLNNATHWGFGLATGAGYGLLVGARRKPRVWFGPPFGAAVWAGGYVVLPLIGVYKPIWKYDLETLWKDLSAHLVFGTVTAATFRRLSVR
jgi:hypothetical protein